MKIALLHYAAPPVVGGVERVIGEHARLMADAGHKVRIIAGRGAAVDPRTEFIHLPLVDSRNPSILQAKSELDYGNVPSGFDRLVDRLLNDLGGVLQNLDVLVAHNVCSLHKNLALTAALKRLDDGELHSRLILWHHDLAWTSARYRPELHPGFPWDLLRTDWPEATQVCVSESRREELARLYGVAPERIHVVANGLDPARAFRLDREACDIAARLRLFEAHPLILLPVRITQRKNIELAMRVTAALRAQMPDARLLVTGPLGAHNPANVEYLNRLVALRAQMQIQTAVHLLAEILAEPISDRAAADLYAAADILLLTSRDEGFGIPLLEAGLAGIPIFCTDLPALRELGRSEAHYFQPDADPALVADQIAQALRVSPGYRLKKRILRDFSWSAIYSEQIAPLLEKAAA